jgi:lysophospholipase L1-like esterase
MKKITAFILLLISFCGVICACNNNNTDILKEYYDGKIAAYTEENKTLEEGELDVVFLGDSLTDGYDVARFYPQYKVSNRGISGDTTVGLANRLDVCVYKVKPKVAVMLIGANNMDKMMDNYEDILIGFKENVPDTKIVLLSLTSMSGEWGKKNQLAAYNNVQIKMLAEKYDYEFIDLYSALLNLETGEIYDEYTTDGGHLTEQGYEVLTTKITPVLDKLLVPDKN